MSSFQFFASRCILFAGALVLLSSPAYAFDWQDLWSTPSQRAKKQHDQARYDELIEQAPDANWRGLGEFRNGDYDAAIESFQEQRSAAQQSGANGALEQSMYNQATAHTLNENYPEAIELFDEILNANPDHANASHNKAVAEQLLEQQQQQQQQESGDSEDQSSNEQQGEQQGEQQNQQQGEQQGDDQQQNENADNQNSEQQNAESSSNQSDASQQNAGQEEQDQAEQDAQAARAMEAEAEQQIQQSNEQTENAGSEQAQGSPLTEREQANEQWLRQIPDDPAGLLQRKLQNRHVTDFPKVQDSANPW